MKPLLTPVHADPPPPRPSHEYIWPSALLLLAISAELFWCLRPVHNRYEYHTGQGGTLMYRCDRDTGQVSLSKLGADWQAIDYPAFPSPDGATNQP